uniref:Uncharacterized protein AlNc14C795G12523 n=1 Tax=Albugo laibachii Nc14 TaxID=890382 RepID=F0X224_9STRA|nr:conserved hypothetical protein [Albugo laibachii Nc14]|eukprot:CCA27889.1 conserved hypothetical protein [Albugo laibachii Nc14]
MDHICLRCEKSDGDLWLCTGLCVSAYHLHCLQIDANANLDPTTWKCPSCQNHLHICFYCHQTGSSFYHENAVQQEPSQTHTPPLHDNISYVSKCRALSCGKFYHLECITKLALARIAGTHFICPLHTCASCEQSGAKKESVRCARCPVAYHTSCLPRKNVQLLTGNCILCPKHEKKEKEAICDGEESESKQITDTEEESEVINENETELRQYVQSLKRDKKKKKKKKRKRKCVEDAVRNMEMDSVFDDTHSIESALPNTFDKVTVETSNATLSDAFYQVNCIESTQIECEDRLQSSSSVIPISTEIESNTEATQVKQETIQDDNHHRRFNATLAESEEKERSKHHFDIILYPPKAFDFHKNDAQPPNVISRDDTIARVGNEIDNIEALEDETLLENDAFEHRKETLKKAKRLKRDVNQDEEAKWVQCDACEKWRIVPKEFDLDTMPEQWFCHMNTWNTQAATCEIPEEASTILSEKGKAARAAAVSRRKRKAKQVKAKKSSDSHCLIDRKQRSESVLTVKVPSSEDAFSLASGSLGSNGTPNTGKKRKLKVKEKHKEVKWVQCENPKCGKWRIVPSHINISVLPVTWYCHLNTWAPELARCDVTNPPEVENIFATKPQARRSSKKSKGHSDICVSNGSGKSSLANQTTASNAKSLKQSRHWKSTTPMSCASNTGMDTGTHTDWNTANGIPIAKGIGIKKTVLEWAQCEKCNKWRKLPQHIKSSTLPDKWFCSMNHWDVARASCRVPEEVDNEPLEHKTMVHLEGSTRVLKPQEENGCVEVLPSVNMTGTFANTSHAKGTFRAKRGKLSYTELLFASTGHLRKTYTEESSTSSFEHEGIVYYRDDQYSESSLYATSGKSALRDEKLPEEMEEMANIEKIASDIMGIMSVREAKSIREIVCEMMKVEGISPKSAHVSEMLSLLPGIAHALNYLMDTKQVERVEVSATMKTVDAIESEGDTSTKLSIGALPIGLESFPRNTGFVQYYRRAPLRPLQARKLWKVCATTMLIT